MIVSTKAILEEAKKGGYAVGAFNTVNLETTKAILEAAGELSSPVVVQMTEKTLDYAGGRVMFELVKNMAEFYFPKLPVSIHLDHGKSLEIVERAIELGFPSVMYDGSRKTYNDNLRTTKKVVELAKEGEQWAVQELFNRIDGKPAQQIVGDDDRSNVRQGTRCQYRVGTASLRCHCRINDSGARRIGTCRPYLHSSVPGGNVEIRRNGFVGNSRECSRCINIDVNRGRIGRRVNNADLCRD